MTSSVPQKPVMPKHQRMIIAQSALAHQRMGDRDLHVIDEGLELLGGTRQENAAARIEYGMCQPLRAR